MIWIPIGLGLFKVVVLGTTIFFAIKSHRDEEKMQKEKGRTRKQYVADEHTLEAAEPDQDVGG
ncbi:hypothetical protein FJU08_21665 [Martelella alba]|uniref:Uncharacterized protein n=1 Tax=Martelella alba TaxID=2590451 RepID=A0A506U2I1_9HYPH|nr:hypothetical protein [Martelella alba]TPW26779.1 hypothetical protein FJU08_21665 [Martelella alba]